MDFGAQISTRPKPYLYFFFSLQQILTMRLLGAITTEKNTAVLFSWNFPSMVGLGEGRDILQINI